MATALAGFAAAAVVIPFKAESTAAPPDAVATPHPDQAIFNLRDKWRVAFNNCEQVRARQSALREKLCAAMPEKLILRDPIPLSRDYVADAGEAEDGWRITWLRQIVEDRYSHACCRKSKNGRVFSVVNKRMRSTAAAKRVAAVMIARLEENENERHIIWERFERLEEKLDRALKPADRVAAKMSKIPATTIQGLQAKLEVFQGSGMILTSDDYSAGILRDVELMSA